MPEYNLNLSTKTVWNGGFVMDVTLTNTGSAPLESPYVDIIGSADIERAWGGSHTLLDNGMVRLHFDGVTIAPGDSAKLGFKAEGQPDFRLAEDRRGAQDRDYTCGTPAKQCLAIGQLRAAQR